MSLLTAVSPTYQVIVEDRLLSSLIEACRGMAWVAIDTEFMRTRTYYPQIGLIQIANDNGLFLIDPVAITDKGPLTELLADPTIVKVMHACSEDLEVFQCYLGQLPEPLFDTQIAAALLGYGFQVGYKALVEQTHQVHLPKEEQRSDWLARPLSGSQLDYAAMDVSFLAEIYLQQVPALQRLKRLDWLQEECANLLRKQRQTLSPEQQYQRVKGAGTLNEQQLGILQPLAAWRETEAERRNLPRGFLLKDQALVDLVREQPTTMQALSKVTTIHPKTVRKDGGRILDIIATAVDNGAVIETLQGTLSRRAKPLLKRMQKHIAAIADQLGIPAELMMNRKQLVSCLQQVMCGADFVLPAELSQWKRNLLEPGLAKIVSDFNAEQS